VNQLIEWSINSFTRGSGTSYLWQPCSNGFCSYASLVLCHKLSAQFLCVQSHFKLTEGSPFPIDLVQIVQTFSAHFKHKVSSSKGKCSVTPFGQAIFVMLPDPSSTIILTCKSSPSFSGYASEVNQISYIKMSICSS
jgi:hypothetical protein